MPDWICRVVHALPEWITAVGTGGAFLVAGLAYRTSVRDSHAKQARLVQAYQDGLVDYFDYDVAGPASIDPAKYAATHFFGNSVSGAPEGHDLYLEDDCVLITVLLDNRSLEFVHNIDVDLLTIAGEDLQVRLHVDTHPPETTSRLLAVLPTRPNEVMDGVRTRLTFTDAAGNRWVVEYGHPVRELR